jgi:hypothetical protein
MATPTAKFQRLVLWVVLLAGAGIAVVVWRRAGERDDPAVDRAEPVWPPFDAPLVDQPANQPAVSWVSPVDGTCPPGYPVKANAASGIYHVEGGRFYARTTPDRCYATTVDAEADGYRAAKA